MNNVIYWFKNTRAAVKRAEMKSRQAIDLVRPGGPNPARPLAAASDPTVGFPAGIMWPWATSRMKASLTNLLSTLPSAPSSRSGEFPQKQGENGGFSGLCQSLSEGSGSPFSPLIDGGTRQEGSLGDAADVEDFEEAARGHRENASPAKGHPSLSQSTAQHAGEEKPLADSGSDVKSVFENAFANFEEAKLLRGELSHAPTPTGLPVPVAPSIGPDVSTSAVVGSLFDPRLIYLSHYMSPFLPVSASLLSSLYDA